MLLKAVLSDQAKKRGRREPPETTATQGDNMCVRARPVPSEEQESVHCDRPASDQQVDNNYKHQQQEEPSRLATLALKIPSFQ